MKNKKLRTWDNDFLTSTYSKAEQLRVRIEFLASQTTPANTRLPHSVLDTEVLYDLTLCLELMYNMLLDKDLIETGNKKQTFELH